MAARQLGNPLADGYFPVVRTRRDGAVIAASATEGLLAYEPDARARGRQHQRLSTRRSTKSHSSKIFTVH